LAYQFWYGSINVYKVLGGVIMEGPGDSWFWLFSEDGE
jgi:hypothetical protein